jgi:flagellar hook assembly protein FlgD
VCTPSPASEQDSIRISSGDADTVIGIYVKHLSDSLFAFPNPFGNIPGSLGRTQVFYSLQRASSVKLTIYDPFGNKIWTRSYLSGEPGALFGDNTVYWDGTNNRGQRVASGVYLIQVLGRTGTVIDFKSLYRVGVVW